MTRLARPLLAAALGWMLLALTGGDEIRGQVAADSGRSQSDPLAARGWAVTSGAAPGYVADRLCGSCHAVLYRGYQEVGMARSFYRPRRSTAIEDFEQGFFHRKSRRHYRIFLRDGRYVFRRHQLDAKGKPTRVFEQEIDWVLGSGNHSRTYLYRTPGGELYQLPIALYPQTASWGMAPGFDQPHHEGVGRRVRRECMFCHNAYPDVAAASDDYSAPQVFPKELPEGLGCQRCHGPGAEHARIAMTEPVDFEQLAASIVHPGRLSPRLRDDICYGCHMQPSVVLPGVRRFGRGDYSFRPGEPLPDYLVQVDVTEEGEERSERFEINHHPYRLEQSRCFAESDGALSCLSCHDPHRKVKEAERAAHYRAACLGCHQLNDCRLEEMTAAAGHVGPPSIDPGDCSGCHMPKRRTQDVVRVVMTDHLIRRQPGGDELLATLEESEPVLVDVELMEPKSHSEGGPTRPRLAGDLGEVYRAAAVVRLGVGSDALDRLDKMLARAPTPALDPYLDLARGQLRLRRAAEAERTLGDILSRAPEHLVARDWRVIAKADLGRLEEAITLARGAVERGSDRAEAHFNLARLLSGSGSLAESLVHYRRAIGLRPNMTSAHFQLGKALARLERPDDAAVSFRRTLEIDPGHSEAYLGLAWAQVEQGDHGAALETLRHGTRAAMRPAPIQDALERLRAAIPPKGGQ